MENKLNTQLGFNLPATAMGIYGDGPSHISVGRLEKPEFKPATPGLPNEFFRQKLHIIFSDEDLCSIQGCGESGYKTIQNSSSLLELKSGSKSLKLCKKHVIQCNNLHRTSPAKSKGRPRGLCQKAKKTKRQLVDEKKEPYITECSGCNKKYTLHGSFCQLHTVQNNGNSFAVPCTTFPQTCRFEGKSFDGFMCSFCSITIANANCSSKKQENDTLTDDNICHTEDIVTHGKRSDVVREQLTVANEKVNSEKDLLYPFSKATVFNAPTTETKDAISSVKDQLSVANNAVASAENGISPVSSHNYNMKSLAHELIDILPYKGWTVAFSPGNIIHLFLDWSDEGSYFKQINVFQSRAEIVVNNVTVETIPNISLNVEKMQELCERVVQIDVCRGLSDPAVVSFCEDEQVRNRLSNNIYYNVCKEQGKLVVRSTSCTQTKNTNKFSQTQHCSECQKLWRHRIRSRPGFKTCNDTDSMNTRLSSLSYEQLIQRCQLLKKRIKAEKESNRRLLKTYKALNKKSSKIPFPHNFNPTSTSLGKSVDFALEQKWLSENSVLFALIQDTVIALKKREENNGKPSPGMRCSPLVIKWCNNLAEQCKRKGYEAIRKIIPIPHIRTIRSYKNHSTSFKGIEEENINRMVQEMNRRNCQGLGGIHWDEIYIKDGIKVNVRTNELVGFEEVNINEELLTESMYKENAEENKVHEDSNKTEDTGAGKSMSEKAKMILQFFWTSISGDFSWPVASFPISSMNCTKLTECVWQVVESLSTLKINSKLERIHTVYGVCDGAPYSSAFCNRAGSKNYVTENPYHSGVPIYWLSDPPHMLKKLRNHILSTKRNLQRDDRHVKFEHFLDVADRGMTNVHYRHIYLDHRSKMNVKKASQLLSLEVADDLLKNSSLDLYETSLTRQYIKKCNTYFKIMNSLHMEKGNIRQLFSILCWFKKWKKEIKEEYRLTKDADKWTKFTPLTTYRDLKRSIRGFSALYLYTSLHFPNISFVPRTTNQDDVENYFSLQRGRCPGELTVEKYMTNNTAISTSMLIKAENKELTDQMGSYNYACLPNFVSMPLQRLKSSSSRQSHKLWTTEDILVEHDVTNRQKPTYLQKDDKILWDQLSCIFNQLNAQSPTVLIAYVHKVLLQLQEKKNRPTVLGFFHNIDEKVRYSFFKDGSWAKDSLIEAEKYIRADRSLREDWTKLLSNYMLPVNENKQDSTTLLGMIVTKF